MANLLPGAKTDLYRLLNEAGILPDHVINFSIHVPLDGGILGKLAESGDNGEP